MEKGTKQALNGGIHMSEEVRERLETITGYMLLIFGLISTLLAICIVIDMIAPDTIGLKTAIEATIYPKGTKINP